MDSDPLHVPAQSREVYGFREHRFRFLAETGETGGSYSWTSNHRGALGRTPTAILGPRSGSTF